jgi:DNA invertase Pin-like site-specific DNA recombinase
MPGSKPTAHLYARISHPDQRKGGGLERQTTAAVGDFCSRFGFTMARHVWVDDGVSAYHGLNATPDHQLGQFIALAKRGTQIRPGDCLLIENYDRLSRQDVWAATGLVGDLRQLKIHVGRLDSGKLLRYDSTDSGDFFEAAIELMRGNSESKAKAERNGKAWKRKRAAARDHGKILTRRLPAWVAEDHGVLVLIPERAAVVKHIFELSRAGHGHALIVRRLTAAGVPPMGRVSKWKRSYVASILKDRRAVGELQPCLRDGTPAGPPIKDYYPAVVSEDEWARGRGAATDRRNKPGRPGNDILNVFAGLLRDALSDGTYFLAARVARRGQTGTRHVLLNTSTAEGRAAARSFPFDTFERALLGQLRELDAAKVLGQETPEEGPLLEAARDGIDAELAQARAFMDQNGFSVTIGGHITALEARRAALETQLEEVTARAAHPAKEAWRDATSIIDLLDDAPDPTEARLRLRGALRRTIDSIHLVVVPRGGVRLCAAQVWFRPEKGTPTICRSYLILHEAAPSRAKDRSPRWSVRSFADALAQGDLDLRKIDHAHRLEQQLTAIDLATLADAAGGR